MNDKLSEMDAADMQTAYAVGGYRRPEFRAAVAKALSQANVETVKRSVR